MNEIRVRQVEKFQEDFIEVLNLFHPRLVCHAKAMIEEREGERRKVNGVGGNREGRQMRVEA